MPFTGSHPAAILPLLRLGLPTSALVLGTVVPDLSYYLPMPVTAAQTHSLAGVFGADLMLGLCAFLVWHLLLVQAVLWAAPAGLQRRVPNQLRRGLAGRLDSSADLARVLIALVIGAATHVAWDAFTHAGMWGVRALPWLDTTVAGLALFRWLHMASSALGLAWLAWFAVRWWPRAPLTGDTSPIRPGLRWSLALALLGWAGVAAASAGAALVQAPGRVGRQTLAIELIVQFVSTMTVGLIAAAVAWHLVAAVGRSRGQRDRPVPEAVPRNL